MSVGVITHLHNATFDEVRDLARAAEAAGADWLGIPDAFWWRDGWMLLVEAARATERIGLGRWSPIRICAIRFTRSRRWQRCRIWPASACFSASRRAARRSPARRACRVGMRPTGSVD